MDEASGQLLLPCVFCLAPTLTTCKACGSLCQVCKKGIHTKWKEIFHPDTQDIEGQCFKHNKLLWNTSWLPPSGANTFTRPLVEKRITPEPTALFTDETENACISPGAKSARVSSATTAKAGTTRTQPVSTKSRRKRPSSLSRTPKLPQCPKPPREPQSERTAKRASGSKRKREQEGQ
jgi:hypothetical protein